MTTLRAPPAPERIAVDRWTEPFWTAARERRLVACECVRCGTLRMPPGPFCPRCQSGEVAWRALPGTGRVYSYTVVQRAVAPDMEACIPYAPAVIELDDADGMRLVSAIVESPLEALAVGARVALAWFPLPSGDVLPYFTLASAAGAASR